MVLRGLMYSYSHSYSICNKKDLNISSVIMTPDEFAGKIKELKDLKEMESEKRGMTNFTTTPEPPPVKHWLYDVSLKQSGSF